MKYSFLIGVVCALSVYADEPRSAYVEYVGFSMPRAYVNTPYGQTDILLVPQIHERYEFYNPADVRVKLVIYVPGTPYTDRLFGKSDLNRLLIKLLKLIRPEYTYHQRAA